MLLFTDPASSSPMRGKFFLLLELPDRSPAAPGLVYRRNVMPELAIPPASDVMVTMFGGGMLLKRIENTP